MTNGDKTGPWQRRIKSANSLFYGRQLYAIIVMTGDIGFGALTRNIRHEFK
jgi:hypothetical protein